MLSTLRQSMLVAFTALSIALMARSGFAQTATQVPMSLTYDQDQMNLTVPNWDTTMSVYGGRLRLYDVHIAKMFEVTFVWCEQGIVHSGLVWNYWAGNGSTNMGDFYVSCRDATRTRAVYGKGWNEPTEIYWIGNDYETWDIPVLAITTESKIDRWLRFVDQFQPIR